MFLNYTYGRGKRGSNGTFKKILLKSINIVIIIFMYLKWLYNVSK